IRITYLSIDAADGLAGLSDGNGLPEDFVESDFSGVTLCADFDRSYKVDMNDVAVLMSHWLEQECSGSVWCEGTDLNRSGSVDFFDFEHYGQYWMQEIDESAPVEAEYVFYSIAADDGRVWDDRDDGYGGGTGVDGNSIDSDEYALRLGDYGRYGYHVILSFDTSVLPADATVTSAVCMLTHNPDAEVGTNPFGWGGSCVVDIVKPYFGSGCNLVPSDWQAAADAYTVASFSDPCGSEVMVSTDFNTEGLGNINLNSTTQLRVYFTIPHSDVNDNDEDLFGYYSGEYTGDANRYYRPKLIVNCLTRTPTVEFTSIAEEDGRIWGEPNSITQEWEGVDYDKNDSSAWALRLGDYQGTISYRNVVSFDTSSLPDDCTILSARLQVTRGDLINTDPFTWGGSCVVDISSPYFGDSNELEVIDWQALPDANVVATFSGDPGDENAMLSSEFDINGLSYINKTGKTQLRFYFTTPVYDVTTDNLCFYSGEYTAGETKQPKLIIKYTME
ncbi:MAG: hypothetical protein ACYSW6_00740, partial [Planctomycetota bacterium]